MTGWKSGDIRPSEGERVAVTFLPPCVASVVHIGRHQETAIFSRDDGWRFPWSAVRAWIPESELVEQSKLVKVKGGE